MAQRAALLFSPSFSSCPTKLFFLLLLALPGLSLSAQDRSNPFEIRTRLPDPAGAPAAVSAPAERPDYSPFDIRRTSAGPLLSASPLAPAAAQNGAARNVPLVVQPTDPNQGRGSILTIQLLLLLMVTSLWVLFGNLLRQVLRGTVNDSLMTQVYTRRSGGEETALWLCYVFFFLSTGFFLYRVAVYYDVSLGLGIWGSWGTYSLVVAAAVGLRHWVLFVFARLFPVRKEVSRYAFVMMVFSILAGLLLVPINLASSYAPEAYRPVFLYGGVALLAGVYLFHLLRGWLIAGRMLATRPAHILLYICAVEVAPLLLIYRYLDSVLQ